MRPVLLVEDDDTLRTLLERALRRRFPRSPIDVAQDAESALSLARSRKEESGEAYALLLTDHQMGEMTGAQLISHVSGEGLAQTCILMSGDSDAEDALARDAPGHTFVAKPFAMETMLSLVAAAVT